MVRVAETLRKGVFILMVSYTMVGVYPETHNKIRQEARRRKITICALMEEMINLTTQEVETEDGVVEEVENLRQVRAVES